MKQEHKELLLKDLCARLPYGVKVELHDEVCTLLGYFNDYVILTSNTPIGQQTNIANVKPYLRPMSSMTDEEKKEYKSFIFTQHHEWDGHGTSTEYVEIDDAERYFTWLNKNMFDYRGLIPMGLALEAKEGMYKID